MRKLAHELGVEAMSLYNHVANKDDIVDGIVDLVVGEIELPSDDADWEAAIRQCAISAHEVLLRHLGVQSRDVADREASRPHTAAAVHGVAARTAPREPASRPS